MLNPQNCMCPVISKNWTDKELVFKVKYVGKFDDTTTQTDLPTVSKPPPGSVVVQKKKRGNSILPQATPIANQNLNVNKPQCTFDAISTLHIASNVYYELYVNNKFVSDGGHRCSHKEALADTHNFDQSTDVFLLVHFVGIKNNTWYRMIFDNPFVCDLNNGKWEWYEICDFNVCSTISTQLMRQNFVCNIENYKKCDVTNYEGVNNFKWKYREQNGEFHFVGLEFDSNNVDVAMLETVSKLPKDSKYTASFGNKRVMPDLLNKDIIGTDLQFLPSSLDGGLHCVRSFDSEKIGLHKLFVLKTNSPLLVMYSEVSDLSGAFLSYNRAKVHMCDYYTSVGSHIEWRGCRYMHIISPINAVYSIKIIRKQFKFEWKPLKQFEKNDTKDKMNTIYEACKNNLIACSDGGIVDTCWRERAQWVGDAYISLTTMDKISSSENVSATINNVITQIMDSYDHGMVQGAFPIKTLKKMSFYMQTYHLLYCLLIADLKVEKYYDFLRENLVHFDKEYVKNGLLTNDPLPNTLDNTTGKNVVSWPFVDWGSDNAELSGRGSDNTSYTEPNCFSNILFYHLCKTFNIQTTVTEKTINDAFMNANGLYTMYQHCPLGQKPNNRSYVHATSIAIMYLENVSDKTKNEFVKDLFKNMEHHTMYYGFYIAKALSFDVVSQEKYIIAKYYGLANKLGTIIEKTTDESSRAHGWSVGVSQFLV